MKVPLILPFAVFIAAAVALAIWLAASRKRRYVLWTVLLGLVSLGCLLLYFRALRYDRWKSAFGQFKPLCEVQAAGPMPLITGTAKLLLLDSSPLAGPEIHAWQASLPEEASPERPDELDLVVCVRREYVEVEVCQYRPVGLVSRNRIDLKIRVFDPRTSQKVSEGVLAGQPPPYCPSSYRTNQSVRADGDPPTLADFERWLDQQLGIRLDR